MISQLNKTPPSNIGLIPACFIAEKCVVNPKEAIAIASSNVSMLTAAATTLPDTIESEFSPVTATKMTANHGVIIGALELLASKCLCDDFLRARYTDNTIKNGANIITRTILVITAVFVAISPNGFAAATT